MPWAPPEVGVCLASYAKCLKRLLEFLGMNGPQGRNVSGGQWVTESFVEEGNDLCLKGQEDVLECYPSRSLE